MPQRTMSQRIGPPFRADHVGSLLRPQRLLDARAAKSRGALDAAGLRDVEDDCIREVVKLQEDLGYRGITDGEFRRTWWHLDFIQQFANVTLTAPRIKARFHSEEGDVELLAPAVSVTGKLARPKPIMAADFSFLKSATRQTAKVTIPSPSVLHFRGGLAARPPGMTVSMHLCRGNFKSAWVAEGGYDPVAEVLFNEIEVTGYFLEYDSPRAGSFAPLRFVPKGKTVVLGLVTSKKGVLESADERK